MRVAQTVQQQWGCLAEADGGTPLPRCYSHVPWRFNTNFNTCCRPCCQPPLLHDICVCVNRRQYHVHNAWHHVEILKRRRRTAWAAVCVQAITSLVRLSITDQGSGSFFAHLVERT